MQCCCSPEAEVWHFMPVLSGNFEENAKKVCSASVIDVISHAFSGSNAGNEECKI